MLQVKWLNPAFCFLSGLQEDIKIGETANVVY